LWWSSACDKCYSFNRRHQMAPEFFQSYKLNQRFYTHLNQVHLTSQIPSTTHLVMAIGRCYYYAHGMVLPSLLAGCWENIEPLVRLSRRLLSSYLPLIEFSEKLARELNPQHFVGPKGWMIPTSTPWRMDGYWHRKGTTVPLMFPLLSEAS
jgi:hypothetical protein